MFTPERFALLFKEFEGGVGGCNSGSPTSLDKNSFFSVGELQTHYKHSAFSADELQTLQIKCFHRKQAQDATNIILSAPDGLPDMLAYGLLAVHGLMQNITSWHISNCAK